MRVSSRSLVVVCLLSSLVGCKDEEPEPPVPKPTLSETPLWQVKADPSFPDECFGSSVALADFDGDGRKDLAVSSQACQELLVSSRNPGRLSIFVGQEKFFSTQAVSAALSWQNTHPNASGQQLRVESGEVNGDAYADLLVYGRYGVSVFLGQADLAAMLSAPSFRVPGNGTFQNSLFVDLNGDGLDDLVANHSASQRFYLSTPGAGGEGGLFTLARTRTGYLRASFVGDLNKDGAEDVSLGFGGGNLGYFLGCKPGSAFACDGPISAEPWRIETLVGRGNLHPDLNGDGHPETFAFSESGPFQFHLSQPDGTFSPTPAWSTQGDPAFPYVSSFAGLASVGDMDGDGVRNDFVLHSSGRLYLFSPKDGISQSMHPVWAWPRADAVPSGYGTYRRYSIAVPGDLNGDGFDDLVVATTEFGDILDVPMGEVSIHAGGQVPATPATPPHLPSPQACGLQVDEVNGKPDLTVDQDVLERTVHVVWRNFEEEDCEVKEQCVLAPGRRKLLRFSTSIQNLGNKAAVLPPIKENPDLYVFDECHGHDHLTNFAAYELRDSAGNAVMTGRKQGYYLVDVQSYCSDAAASTFHEPMGISAGWSDIYTLDTPCQWVDITDVADGTYSFQVSVDTRDIVEEGTVHPNTVAFPVRLEGDTVTVLP
ncbi:lysyl oxidase family protein [Myxococcus sp. CA040A]|uniref:lysyl oxidase family protein n=1 Tax=Myxococcus sp. CA040A TaxID=2741738 RepID=UPI00157A8454|nr:lysyl oxidase family protein [Myxococcus sp. CA040A]NTX05809.1 VCBS repeat-containing protein [Myxococcus sp. CA040A]